MNDLLTYDYSRSFVQWTDNHAHHSPRCALHASCKLRSKDGVTREFFLTHPCVGEKMYADENIIHVPTSDFHMVFAADKEYMIVKVLAAPPYELRMDHRIGETVATHDGRGAIILRMDATLRNFPSVRALKTDDEVYEAMMADLPILGRTRFQGDDGETEVISEYPVTVMNARHEDHRWQVDTGPVLLPDFSLQPRLPVGLFRQAFLVYNSWNWAQVAMRLPIKTAGSEVMIHYTAPSRINVQNQLFAADI